MVEEHEARVGLAGALEHGLARGIFRNHAHTAERTARKSDLLVDERLVLERVEQLVLTQVIADEHQDGLRPGRRGSGLGLSLVRVDRDAGHDALHLREVVDALPADLERTRRLGRA